MYTKEMGPPPIDTDMASSLTPAQRRAAEQKAAAQTKKDYPPKPVKKAMGGKVKKYAKGGVTRADGCITKGRTKGRMV